MPDIISAKIKRLFVIRVGLWIVAFASTAYWIYFSIKLHMDGIFEETEYATLLRPVLYTCLLIAVAAICISFALYRRSKKLKDNYKRFSKRLSPLDGYNI
ncbi:hypothetical protein [Butyrivibrio sp. AE3004]|uniref:hypothetical protein n=1 Tax=Butyrivibrio sp. AE3004 TaxID=1506994 RepID=UPI0004941F37|nr:hypothetical protein [Butyrivibrio sp. AE3004]